MFLKRNYFSCYLLYLCLLYIGSISNEKERLKITWKKCEQCNDSLCGTKEISTTARLHNDSKNTTLLFGTFTLQIPLDDSIMINFQIWSGDDKDGLEGRHSNIRFNRACSDIYGFLGGRWKTLWEYIPQKCPIPKGSYTLRGADINQLISHKSLFLPSIFIRGDYTFLGKIKKKRSGTVVGCLLSSIKFN